jgi:PIF1-like helicase
MMLHGMGGSGKSTVIALVMAYAQEYCKILRHPFTIRTTIVVTALSGVAATLIHGGTTHVAMGLNKESITLEMIEGWEDTRLVLVDECSFASRDVFKKIQERAVQLKPGENRCFLLFGGINIVYSGDFSQLEPPRRDAIYRGNPCSAFRLVLNAFIELDGQHRYRDDPEYGEINFRLRNGCAQVEDIQRINSVCCISPTHRPDPNVPVAVYRNRSCDAINCAMFEEYCSKNRQTDLGGIFGGAILIFTDNLQMRDTTKRFVPVLSNEVKNYFFRNCGR